MLGGLTVINAALMPDGTIQQSQVRVNITAIGELDGQLLSRLHSQIVDICEAIGPLEIGTPRVKCAEEIMRAQTLIIELVAGTVCERVFFPDHEPLPAEHDLAEPRALASVKCASPRALLRFAEVEAETLIRALLSIVNGADR